MNSIPNRIQGEGARGHEKGIRNELRVLYALEKLFFLTENVLSVRKSFESEEPEGKDIVVHTTFGDIFFQVKSSRGEAAKFRGKQRKGRYNNHILLVCVDGLSSEEQLYNELKQITKGCFTKLVANTGDWLYTAPQKITKSIEVVKEERDLNKDKRFEEARVFSVRKFIPTIESRIKFISKHVFGLANDYRIKSLRFAQNEESFSVETVHGDFVFMMCEDAAKARELFLNRKKSYNPQGQKLMFVVDSIMTFNSGELRICWQTVSKDILDYLINKRAGRSAKENTIMVVNNHIALK